MIDPPPTAGSATPAVRMLSPEVRRIAAERGISDAVLRTLEGSGRGGRVLPSDLNGVATRAPQFTDVATTLAASAASLVQRNEDGGVTVPLDPVRRARAQAALEDAVSGAPVTSIIEMDLNRPIRRFIDEGLTGEAVRDALLPVIVRHLLTVLTEHPVMHARIDVGSGVVVHRESVDLRLTIDSERSEATMLIEDIASLSAADLHTRIASARLLAASGHGVFERPPASLWLIERRTTPVLFETPPLTAGVSCTLALGLVERRPLADTSTALRIGWAAYLCCTYDHRLVDGADAARFLGDLAALVAADR